MMQSKYFYRNSDIEEICQRIHEPAQALAGKKVLVTGGLGFLGKYFSAVLSELNRNHLKTPCHFLLVDNLITGRDRQIPDLNPDHAQIIEHDMVKPFDPEKIWGAGPDYILHAAGIASPFYYREFPLETLDVAITGTRHMLELAKKSRARLVFFSSSEIYGDPDPKHVPTPESYRGNVASLGPRACYDESKRLGETLCYIYHHKYGGDSIIVRPFNVYGPGMTPIDYRVLPNFATRILSGQTLKVYGDGNQTRTFCYITDAMVGFFLALLKGVRGEPYNIGNPKPEISMLTLVQTLEKVLGTKLQYDVIEHPDTYPADEPMRRCPDLSKSRLQLGYEPRVDLETGLAKFMSWAKENFPAS